MPISSVNQPVVSIGSGSDGIILQISEDSYKGDAQYAVSVDGQPIGGVLTATASHALGETQDIKVLGNFGIGPHTVTIDFLNDAYDGTAATDRNLYVDSAGETLLSAGPVSFTATAVDTGVTDTASLSTAIDAADAATSGDIVINLASNIVETAALEAINLQPGVTLTINGQGHTLSGGNSFRGLFAYAGTITIQNLTISAALAQGGRGGSEGAGGGAGLGGGLFVAGTNPGLTSGANVTLDNVTFTANRAVGGVGSGGGGNFEGNLGPYGTAGGGGGMGGDGGSYDIAGGGGGGIGGAGGTGGVGLAGIAPGAAGGGGGAAAGSPNGAFGGGAGGGGGGTGVAGSFGNAGGGGIGGSTGSAAAGGNGGFGGGGGGGGGTSTGGNGGFGGGGGSSGGNGGFGGGGGDRSQTGGFGAGNGSTAADRNGTWSYYDGGGGLGAGGAVFVQAGGVLTIAGGSASGGSVAGGLGGTGYQEVSPPSSRNGEGLGAGYFLQGNQILNFAEVAGQSTTASAVIADQTGSGGTGANTGAGSVVVSGAGTLVLAATNTYTGGTQIAGCTLDLAASGAAGSGSIAFTGTTPAELKLEGAALPAGGAFTNVVSGFGANHTIDLAGLGFAADAGATISGDTLKVSSGGVTDWLTLGNIASAPTSLMAVNDGYGGVLVRAAAEDTTPDTINLGISEDAYNGDAQYAIFVDGTQQGGVRTATASHAAGQIEQVTLTGTWGSGNHNFAVAFLNDAYGGSPQADRNLYVDSLGYDGQSAMSGSVAIDTNSTMAFITPASVANTGLRLFLAEDAYQGDAQYSVAVDGTQLGGFGTVTAAHATGQTQVVDVLSALAPGTHDLALSFVNDLYGGDATTDRNLYLQGITVNGTSVNVASATFYGNGTQHFSIVVPQV